MAGSAKTTGQSYYESMPSVDLYVGDIWRGMPSFGHLRRKTCGGLVITPACDLSNKKVETITYLPVISVREYMLGRGFSIEMTRVVRAQGQVACIPDLDQWQLRGIALPGVELMQRTLACAQAICSAAANDKIKTAAARVKAAVSVLLGVRGVAVKTDLDMVRHAMGQKEFDRCLGEIIRNSYSSEIHFLPADGRDGDYSAMKQHSVALFRYPMALPVELLQAANDIAVTDWTCAVDALVDEFPVVDSARAERPVKVAALKPRFLPDLISRFATLHIRMGSPDFTRETVETYIENFEGKK